MYYHHHKIHIFFFQPINDFIIKCKPIVAIYQPNYRCYGYYFRYDQFDDEQVIIFLIDSPIMVAKGPLMKRNNWAGIEGKLF